MGREVSSALAENIVLLLEFIKHRGGTRNGATKENKAYMLAKQSTASSLIGMGMK